MVGVERLFLAAVLCPPFALVRQRLGRLGLDLLSICGGSRRSACSTRVFAAGVPTPKGKLPPQTTTPQCHKER